MEGGWFLTISQLRISYRPISPAPPLTARRCKNRLLYTCEEPVTTGLRLPPALAGSFLRSALSSPSVFASSRLTPRWPTHIPGPSTEGYISTVFTTVIPTFARGAWYAFFSIFFDFYFSLLCVRVACHFRFLRIYNLLIQCARSSRHRPFI